MQEFDCTKNCKMTRAVRESGFCIGKSYFDGTKITFGCQSSIQNLAKEEKEWMECKTWDAELFSACNSCPLFCSKNPNKKQKEEKRKKIAAALSEIKVTAAGFGLSVEQIEKLSETYSSNSDMSDEQISALQSAKAANEIIALASSGKYVDISAVTALKEQLGLKLLRKRSKLRDAN